MLTPEQQARTNIDDHLTQAGWIVQDLKDFNHSTNLGISVRDYPTESGSTDYLLFVICKLLGDIEVKLEAVSLDRLSMRK